MKLNEIVSNRSIILVCGNLCSGKGHYCMAQYPEYTRIGVSDIVKDLSKFTDRSQLGTTAHLDQAIAKVLIEKIEQHDKVIVDGIRQMSIMTALEQHFGKQVKDIIWLDVPHDELRNRYQSRGSSKDKTMSFDQALASDRGLGIGDVEDYIKKHHRTVDYSNETE